MPCVTSSRGVFALIAQFKSTPKVQYLGFAAALVRVDGWEREVLYEPLPETEKGSTVLWF